MKYTNAQIEEMKDLMLGYLTANLPNVGYVHIDFNPMTHGIESETAYTDYLGSRAGISFFEISYDAVLAEYPTEFKRMIAHELIHVYQQLRGDKFDFSLPYREQPHEIEAYNREDEVAAYYDEVKREVA